MTVIGMILEASTKFVAGDLYFGLVLIDLLIVVAFIERSD